MNGSPASPDFSDPREVFLAFAAEMNRWGRAAIDADRAAKDGDPEAPFVPVREDLLRIFRLYCTPRERKSGRPAVLHFSRPPDYDPEAEPIISIEYPKAARAVLQTRDTRRDLEFSYVLLRKDGRWLLDGKKIRSGDGWSNWNL